MATPGSEDHAQARRKVATLVESPSESRSLLPAVVGLLDHDDRHLRLSAACCVCLAGAADADLLEYLLGRLIDRLDTTDPTAEVAFAFEYLVSQYPDRAAEIVDDASEQRGRDPLAYVERGGFRRSDIYSESLDKATDRDVGRTRDAGAGQSPGPEQVYTDDVDVEEERRRREDGDDTDSDTADRGGDGADTIEETRPRAGPKQSGLGEPVDTDPDDIPSEVLTALLDGPVFDDVTLEAIGEPSRFAYRYRLLGIVRGQEQAVDLRVFHDPERGRTQFEDRLRGVLQTWQSISDPGAVPCYDYGTDPQPWAAVEYSGSTLDERGALGPASALANAASLAGTVARLHESGTVHGGLEPRAVAYASAVDSAEDDQPRIDDIGVLEPFRYPYDPAAVLDPRYAAPEYFDTSHGAVDHATDVYQLGAVCYRLFTGRPPYDVDPAAAGPRVLEGDPPAPSAVVEAVPGLVDRIVEKAMAGQKLTRYESAARMEQDLLRLREQFDYDG